MELERQRQRLDKWLWAARFFKTRSLASDQVQKGRVRVNGQKAKASRPLLVGDLLIIEKLPYSFEVEVLALNEKRRPATEARLMYCESPASIERRQEISAMHRADRAVAQGLRGEGRPSKRQRRQIIRFRNQSDADDPADE